MAGVGPIVMLLSAKPVIGGYLGGIALILVGYAIRLWAAGYLKKMNELTTAGPFAYTRNPLYLGSFLIACGYGLMTWRLDVAIVILALFIIFHGGAILYEESLLRAEFGQPFLDYCKRVPRMLPRLKASAGNGSFSWQMVRYNREHRSVVGTLILIALFGVALYYPPGSLLKLLEALK